MENEIWLDIRGFEGLYQISSFGRIKMLAREYSYLRNYKKSVRKYPERVTKRTYKKNLYHVFKLINKDGIGFPMLIHRIVAAHFIPNPYNREDVNHINGLKWDNRVDNLEWCTRSENMIHAVETGIWTKKFGEDNHRSKMTEQQVIEIRSSPLGCRKLAKAYKIDRTTVARIRNGQLWKSLD